MRGEKRRGKGEMGVGLWDVKWWVRIGVGSLVSMMGRIGGWRVCLICLEVNVHTVACSAK